MAVVAIAAHLIQSIQEWSNKGGMTMNLGSVATTVAVTLVAVLILAGGCAKQPAVTQARVPAPAAPAQLQAPAPAPAPAPPAPVAAAPEPAPAAPAPRVAKPA